MMITITNVLNITPIIVAA